MDENALHASVVKFLIDGGQADEAAALLSCTLTVQPRTEHNIYSKETVYTDIILEGPRPVYELFYKNGRNNQSPLQKTLAHAFEAFFEHLGTIQMRATLIDLDSPNWKERLERVLTGGSTQGLSAEKSPFRQFWQGMYFRSAAVLQIAKKLDQRGVLYLPGSMMRLGVTEMRQNVEPDFLICHTGKWGILEIRDSLNPALDSKQERLLKFHGIKVIESFDADFCLEYPDNVVNDFLNIVENS